MITSITYKLYEIEDKQTIPKQWNDISITSIPKNKEKCLKNKKALRIISLYQMYEKVKYIMNPRMTQNMSVMQRSGWKKSTC